MVSTKWGRLVRFIAQEDGQEHIGEPVDEDQDVGAALASSKPVSVREYTGTSALDLTASPSSRTLTIQQLLPPLSRSEVGTIRCVGLNYRNHAKEMNLALPEHPTLFFKPSTCLGAPNAPLVIPSQAAVAGHDEADYECELAVVIGKTARNVAAADALGYVLGYACANDVTARQHQFRGAQWGFGKGFDGFAPLGPCLVRLADPSVVRLQTVLNGEVMQDACADDMIFSVPEIVAYLSQGTTLEAGTVILTGTPHGIGVSRTPPVFLRPGDDLRVVMSHGLGSLVNRVEYEKAPGAVSALKTNGV